MKIETTVVAEIAGTPMYCFNGLSQHIPTGAKVTVEWLADNEHECAEAKANDRFVRSTRGKWHVMEKWQGCAGECLLENVTVCPDCGKKMWG